MQAETVAQQQFLDENPTLVSLGNGKLQKLIDSLISKLKEVFRVVEAGFGADIRIQVDGTSQCRKWSFKFEYGSAHSGTPPVTAQHTSSLSILLLLIGPTSCSSARLRHILVDEHIHAKFSRVLKRNAPVEQDVGRERKVPDAWCNL